LALRHVVIDVRNYADMKDKTTAETKTPTTNAQGSPLVGKYFHTIKDGRVQHQGQIMAKVDDTHYLVDLISFLTGMCTNQRLYAVTDMKDWLIYGTQGDMMFSYEHGVASQMDRARQAGN
jgi:hypothetical protein